MIITFYDYCKFLFFLADSVPSWNFSHTHREKLFEKILPSEFCYSLSTDSKYEKRDFLGDEKKFPENFADKKFGKKTKFNENSNKRNVTINFNNNLFRILNRPIEYGNEIFSIHFNKLNLNFYRKHYGGGNVIKCFAKNFVIVGAESRFSGKIGISSTIMFSIKI